MGIFNYLSLKLFSFNLRPALVEYDFYGIYYYPFMGRKKSIAWNDLTEVVIETTDQGPFLEDLFFVLKSPYAKCRIPQEVMGSGQLLSKLQELPDFNNEAVLNSMTCAENAVFVCWEKK